MNSYNGRQITQMRWQDVKELEKFKFISGEFSFVSEVLEEASKHKPWSKIVEVIENGYAYKPVLIFDTINNELYFGTQENDTLYLQNLYANHGLILEIQYTKATDKLTITSTEENVKTLFGNQSIIGTGNIDLYKHYILLNGRFQCVVISSSNVNCSSETGATQKLKDLLKVTDNHKFYELVTNVATAGGGVLQYYNSVLRIMFNGGPIEITEITDIVTTI